MRRVDQLADLIYQMWLQRHPKQNALADAPDTESTDTGAWAEFRINATTYRSYDTRWYDRPGWARATGLTQATKTTCTRVGYALPLQPILMQSTLDFLNTIVPKSEAIESLAQMIAGMPSCVWPLPAATTIATRLIALLPAQSEKPGYSMTASPSAEKAGHLLKIVLVLLSIAFAAASASGIFTAADAPKLDGSNVASFAEAPH